MADNGPEIQSLIDILQEDAHNGDWETRVNAAYEQAMAIVAPEAVIAPRRVKPFTELGPTKQQQLETAADGADILLLTTLLRSQASLDGFDPVAAAGVPHAPSGAGVDFAVRKDVSLTPEGDAMFNYIDRVLSEGNAQIEYPHKLVSNTPPYNGFRTNALEPSEMETLLKQSIAEDIRNGTFPVGNYTPDQAEAAAEQMVAVIKEHALDNIQMRPFKDYYGEDSITFNPTDLDLRTAIDVMMSSDTPLIDNDIHTVMNAKQYGDLYNEALSRYSASMTADDLVAFFEEKVEGYRSHGQQVPGTIDIPEHLRGEFYDQIRDAFVDSAVPAPNGDLSRDSDVFGNKMAEEFRFVDAQNINQPRRDDIFDHGRPVIAVLGDDIGVKTPEGVDLFTFASPNEGFAVYGARDSDHGFYMETVDHVENMDDLKRLFGETFEISPAGMPDTDLNGDNTELSGYFIKAENGNTFYIGFDGLPEENVSAAFKELRADDLDTISRDAVTGVSYAIAPASPGV